MAVVAAVEVCFLHPVAPATEASFWVLLVQNCRFHGRRVSLPEAVPRHLLVVAAAWLSTAER